MKKEYSDIYNQAVAWAGMNDVKTRTETVGQMQNYAETRSNRLKMVQNLCKEYSDGQHRGLNEICEYLECRPDDLERFMSALSSLLQNN